MSHNNIKNNIRTQAKQTAPKVCVLMGSPRPKGNTATLTGYFIERLKHLGADVDYNYLYGMNISPCEGCYHCQNVPEKYGCKIQDDVPMLMEKILQSDCIVLATPIFSWYCTAPMKAFLDRHYGMNKYYGSAEGCLQQGKKVALITTNGYEQGYGTDPFEQGVKRLCQHSNLDYLGMISVQDEDNLASFTTDEAIAKAENFAEFILQQLNL